jgi:hypothetical protein
MDGPMQGPKMVQGVVHSGPWIGPKLGPDRAGLDGRCVGAVLELFWSFALS